MASEIVAIVGCPTLITAEGLGQKAGCEAEGTVAKVERHGGGTW
jgi:hypothetical protein